MPEKILMNWSGGKDSAFALFHLLQDKKVEVTSLFTSVNEKTERISMHGVHRNLLRKQAAAIGLPLHQLKLPEQVSMEDYEILMSENLQIFSEQGVHLAAFGDILLEDLKLYRDKQLSKIGWQGIYPLWGKNTTDLVLEFLDLGFKTRLCCINSKFLPSDFLGQDLSRDLLKDLPKNVDPCGENGEFHTFVYEGPIFKHPLKIKNGERVVQGYQHDGQSYTFEFIDLLSE